MDKSLPTTEELASAYVEYAHTKNEELSWSFDAAIDLWLEADWDGLWGLLKAIDALPIEISDKAIGFIAAGPLEDLLSKNGTAYVEKVLDLARKSPRFSKMLTGVWRSDIQPEVWERIVQFCRSVPNPLDEVYNY